MSLQPSLWDTAPVPVRRLPPHQRGSETSRDAASRAAKFVGPQGERLYAFLLACGEFGATDREAHVVTGIERQSICPRRRALMFQGRVVKSSEVREGCAVYKVVGC